MCARHYPDEEILRHFRPEPCGGSWVVRSVVDNRLVGTYGGGEPTLYATRESALDSGARGLRHRRAAANGLGMLDDWRGPDDWGDTSGDEGDSPGP